MKIKVEHLAAFSSLDEYKLCISNSDPNFSLIYKAGDLPTHRGYLFTDVHFQKFQEKQIKQVNLLVGSEFKHELLHKFSDEYPTSHGSVRLDILVEEADNYTYMNRKSRKKRTIIVLDDITIPNPSNPNIQSIIVNYGEMLTQKILPTLKHREIMQDQVEYRLNEEGVLIFVPGSENFKLQIDLVAILGQFDFPLYNATEVEEAFKIYAEKRPRLVIIGKLGENILSKELFLFLQEYDPYVKKMDYKESPAKYRSEEQMRIKKNYFRNYGGFIAAEKEQKENLPDDIRRSLLDSITPFHRKFQKDAFIEKAFAIKQFDRTFNIQMIWQQILTIRSKNSAAFPILKYF